MIYLEASYHCFTFPYVTYRSVNINTDTHAFLTTNAEGGQKDELQATYGPNIVLRCLYLTSNFSMIVNWLTSERICIYTCTMHYPIRWKVNTYTYPGWSQLNRTGWQSKEIECPTLIKFFHFTVHWIETGKCWVVHLRLSADWRNLSYPVVESLKRKT